MTISKRARVVNVRSGGGISVVKSTRSAVNIRYIDSSQNKKKAGNYYRWHSRKHAFLIRIQIQKVSKRDRSISVITVVSPLTIISTNRWRNFGGKLFHILYLIVHVGRSLLCTNHEKVWFRVTVSGCLTWQDKELSQRKKSLTQSLGATVNKRQPRLISKSPT